MRQMSCFVQNRLNLGVKKFYFVPFGVKLFKFTWDNNEAKEYIYNFVLSEVKILSHLKLNRHMLRLNMQTDTKIVVFPSIRQTQIFPIDV